MVQVQVHVPILSLGAHAQEGYGTCLVCLSVCLSVCTLAPTSLVSTIDSRRRTGLETGAHDAIRIIYMHNLGAFHSDAFTVAFSDL